MFFDCTNNNSRHRKELTFFEHLKINKIFNIKKESKLVLYESFRFKFGLPKYWFLLASRSSFMCMKID